MESANEEKPTHWAVFVLIGLLAIAFASAFAWTICEEKQGRYNQGYIDGQNSVTVKYSFNGTVIPLDVQHSVFIQANHVYDCKLWQSNSDYGCKWLTDTLKVEVLTPIVEPKK